MNVRTFKSKVLDIIWDSIKSYSNVSFHVTTSMISKNNGFIFKFHRYGQDLLIHILPHADIRIMMKEEAYNEKTSIYYTFQTTDEHEGLLFIIQKDLDMFIQDFYKGIHYHVLDGLNLSFTLFSKNDDWREMYSAIRP